MKRSLRMETPGESPDELARDLEDAQKELRAIRHALARAIWVEGRKLDPSFRLGVAEIEQQLEHFNRIDIARWIMGDRSLIHDIALAHADVLPRRRNSNAA